MNPKSFILFLFIFFVSCTPADYCDTINNEIKKCQTIIYQTLTNNKEKTLYTKSLQQLYSSEKKIKKLGDYRGEKELLNTATTLIRFYQTTIENLHKENYPNYETFLIDFKTQEHLLIVDYQNAYHSFIKNFDLIQSQL